MDLEPGDAEGHHHIGHGVGLGEEVGDLLAGADVPLGDAVLPHLVLCSLGEAPALPDGLHDLEGPLLVHAAGDQIDHDVVPASDGLSHRGGAGEDQVPGVAQPHVGAVGETGEPHQDIELSRLGLLQHPPDEGGAELRDGGGAGGPQDLVVLIAQYLGGGEDGPGVRVIQGDGLGVHSGEVLHHADHGGIVVAQHIQLQEVGLHGVVFEVGGDDIGVRVIGGMLHRAEVVDLFVLGDDHHAAGVLAGGPLHAGAALGQAQHLRPVGGLAPLFHVLLHIAEGGLLRHRSDGARAEHMVLAEELEGAAVGAGLVFAGEVQVDIGDLVAAEAQEGLEGDVEAVLLIFGPADRADCVGHIGAAARPQGLGRLKVRVLTVGAAVVGGQGVDLGDARHEGHDGGAHRAPGAHQVAVVQGVLDQLLGRHVDHVVVPHEDVVELGLDTVRDDLGGLLAVEPLGLPPHQALELPLRVLQLGGEEAVGQGV